MLIPLYGAARLRSLLGWIGLAAIVVAGMVYTSRTPFPGWAAWLPGLGTVLALRACAKSDGSARTDTWLTRVLGLAPFQHLGRLSYSWYLWHWPVLVFAAGLEFTDIHKLSPLYRTGLVLLSLVFAEASYRLVENPIRHHRVLALTPWRGLAMGLVLTLMGAGLSFYWKETAQSAMQSPEQQFYARAATDRLPGCITSGTDLEECTFGDAESPKTVVLFGDSHAHQWLSALLSISNSDNLKIITLLKSSCPTLMEPVYSNRHGRIYYECDEWKDKALNRIIELSPDLVITSNASLYYPYSATQWQHGLDSTFKYMQYTGQSMLYIRDTPWPGFDVPSCLARNVNRNTSMINDCKFVISEGRPNDIYNWETSAAAPYSVVHIADLTTAVCDARECEVERDGVVLYRDDHHLSATFAASLAPVLAPHIKAALARAQARKAATEAI